MKNIKNIQLAAFFAVIFVVGAFTSCNDDLTLKSLPYLFRPVNFAATLNKTVATISWAAVDSAKSYTLQVSMDSTFKSRMVDTTTTKLFITKEFAGETTFYARVRANAGDTTKNSKFNATLSFKTPKENIFLGYGTSNNTGNLYSAYMNNANTLDIKWQPGANATHLILTSADGSIRDSVSLLAPQLTSGEKAVTSLSKSTWKVAIYNGSILRGTTYGLVEGDVILGPTDNLRTALDNATSGQIIMLSPGVTYAIGGAAYNFSKNVKVKSFSPISRSVVCMTTSGTTTPPTTTSNMMGVVASSAIDSLVFENIDFTGYCDNNTSSIKIGYLFSNKVACTVTNLKFTNCNIHNLGNTTMRLSGGTPTASQRISNLIYNGCVISESGFASGYALVNISKSSDYIDNIVISNSTLYNFSYPVISIVQTATTPMTSVSISNCTFNQTSQNAGGTRVLFNFDYMALTNGISIKNCIFGSSGAATAGLKTTNATVATTITGCYYTSDFVDETLVAGVSYSIKPSMSGYSGNSTSLWKSPLTGDFTLIDTSFKGKGVAGDLRVY